MSEYIHDEWCASKLEETDCDCYVKCLTEKDEEIQYLKDMGEIMLAVIKQLKEGYNERV
jgi:hypothetical protein